MTLEELKKEVYTLIEEYDETNSNYTADPDFSAKINGVINQVQNEIARLKKIDAYEELEVTEGQEIELSEIDKLLYQINIIRGVEANVVGNRIIFNGNGTAKIYYYKYPTTINDDTDDEEKLEIDQDAIEVMVYGVAAGLLSGDVASNYGQVYAERYRELKNELDPRKAMSSIYISGGMEV